MTLAEDLTAQRTRARERLTPEQLAVRERFAQELTESGVGEAALGVGDTAPDFELPDISGTTISSAELRRTGPLIVTFYRGGWCPYCSLELRAWQREAEALKESSIALVAISPETPETGAKTADEFGLEFPALHDHENTVAAKFGLVHHAPPELIARFEKEGDPLAKRQDTDEPTLPLAASYVIDQAGVVRFAFVDIDYTRRAEPSEVIEAARSLASG